MNPLCPTSKLGIATAALLMLSCIGCAFKVVHPPPLVVGLPNHPTRIVHYPRYILVHDTQSNWDIHQVKDNITGLFDGEIVHWIDRPLDAMIPGPPCRPMESCIVSIKNHYAQLPDCAPVRIVDGLFSALGLEKTTVVGGAKIAAAPADPISYFVFTRVIYLTDWAQDTVGEVNTAAGHLVPWKGSFVPHTATAPVNRCVDGAQFGAVTGYIYVLRKISVGLDDIIYGGEWAWGKTISVFVPSGEPVNQMP